MADCKLDIFVLEEIVSHNKENFDPVALAYTSVNAVNRQRQSREILRDITKKFVSGSKKNNAPSLLILNAKGGAKISAKLR